MNGYRELMLRHMYSLFSLPRRVGKRILRETLVFVLARPQMIKLTRGLFAYFPVLKAHLKAKAFAFAGIGETISRPQPEGGPRVKNYTEMSPFFHYNTTFDPQMLIRKHAPSSVKPHKKYATNFLGLLIDPKIFPSHLNKEIGKVEDIPIPANWHADIAEWGAALRAVEFSKSNFTMIEVGCGWGCWMNNTGLVAKRQGLNLNLIGIEGDQGHIDFAKDTLKLNGFKASEYKIHRGIAAATSGYAFFPNNEDSGEVYGQEPVFCNNQQDIENTRKSGKYDEIPMISFEDISKECTRIDLLHIDIQGGEVNFIQDCLDIISKKVAYILIGAHSREIEGRLFEILLKSGWLLEIERPAILSLDPVPRVTVDGVQAWRNLELLPKEINDYSGNLKIILTTSNVKCNEVFFIDVKITNSSKTIWSCVGNCPVYMAYHWKDMHENMVVYDGERTFLSQYEINLAQEIDEKMKVVAPSKPGNYRLVATLVHESVCWFEDRANFTPSEVDIKVV